MSRTREPRDDVVARLYEADQREVDPDEVSVGLGTKATRLLEGVLANLEELDEGINVASERWRVSRMPAIDRAILRLGFYELRFERATPAAVIVSEAVRLAKAFSTERSGPFVNGVLARLAREERDPTGGSSA